MSLAFNRGGKTARDAAQNAMANFRRTRYLTLKPDESVFLRLIDDGDEWISIEQHNFIKTKGAPKDWKSDSGKSWPASMNAVCRYARNRETNEYIFPEFAEDGCFICDNMTNEKGNKERPKWRLWVRAVVREEVFGTQAMADEGHITSKQIGQFVGFRDKMIEVEEDGDKKLVPEVVILNYGMNFFESFLNYFESEGTVLDRDFKVTRTGEKLETKYGVVAATPMESYLRDDEGEWVRDPETQDRVKVRYSLAGEENAELRAKYTAECDLEKVITDHASDDHYATFFDTTKEIPQRKKSSDKEDGAEDEDATETTDTTVEVEHDRITALRKRMQAESDGS